MTHASIYAGSLMDASRHPYEWVTAPLEMSHVAPIILWVCHVTHMNEGNLMDASRHP